MYIRLYILYKYIRLLYKLTDTWTYYIIRGKFLYDNQKGAYVFRYMEFIIYFLGKEKFTKTSIFNANKNISFTQTKDNFFFLNLISSC